MPKEIERRRMVFHQCRIEEARIIAELLVDAKKESVALHGQLSKKPSPDLPQFVDRLSKVLSEKAPEVHEAAVKVLGLAASQLPAYRFKGAASGGIAKYDDFFAVLVCALHKHQ